MRIRALAHIFLPLTLLSADPTQASFRVLPLDTILGHAVMDLKPGEFSVKVNDRVRKVIKVEPPRADVPVRWILVFEPIRDGRYRTLAFLAATEFLRKLPDGDEILLVVRAKDRFQALSKTFSLNREAWAQQMSRIPSLLPEFLTSPVKAGGTQLGLDSGKVETSGNSPAGVQALTSLVNRITKEKEKFSQGRVEGGKIAWSMDSNDILLIKKESKALVDLLQEFAPLHGDKQVLLFSRTVADEATRPGSIHQSSTPDVNDITGANTTLAVADVRLARVSMNVPLADKKLIIHSIAGSGQHQIGFCGELAQSTGGQAITFMNGLEERLPALLMSYRDCVQVTIEGGAGGPAPMSITSTRPNLKIYHPTLQ